MNFVLREKKFLDFSKTPFNMKKKLLIKSIVYRPYSEIITFFIALAITGQVKLSAAIGIADLILKVFSYYFFDLIWDKYVKGNYPPTVVWLTGLSGAGKTTIAREVESRLRLNGTTAMLLDGDEIREIFNQTGFDKKSRDENVKNVGRIAAFLQRRGTVAIVSMISPYREVREECKKMALAFIEIHVSTSLEVCESRDVKGLYKKVRDGEIKNFTGIHESSPYEVPLNPDLILDTAKMDLKECVNSVLNKLKKN